MISVFIVVLLVILSSIVSFQLGKTKVVLPDYPPAGTVRAFCTSCVDLRFVDTEMAAFENEFGVNSFDIFVAPGPSLALASNSTALFATEFATAWDRGLSVSQMVNGTSVAVLCDHENCGYFSASISSYATGSYLERKQIQFAEMSKTLNYLTDYYAPPDYNVTFSGMWIGLDGSVEQVPF